MSLLKHLCCLWKQCNEWKESKIWHCGKELLIYAGVGMGLGCGFCLASSMPWIQFPILENKTKNNKIKTETQRRLAHHRAGFWVLRIPGTLCGLWDSSAVWALGMLSDVVREAALLDILQMIRLKPKPSARFHCFHFVPFRSAHHTSGFASQLYQGIL